MTPTTPNAAGNKSVNSPLKKIVENTPRRVQNKIKNSWYNFQLLIPLWHII